MHQSAETIHHLGESSMNKKVAASRGDQATTACYGLARRFSLHGMRLLDRYLLRELLLPFGYCLGGFLIFWISSELFKDLGELQDRQMRPGDIVEYYLALAPEFLSIVLPVAFLLAILYALTQHARNNEITAMRAAGLSLWRVAAAYFVVGILASLALGAINELWAPDSQARAEFIKHRRTSGATRFDPHLVRGMGLFNAGANRHWVNGYYNSDSGEMISPLVVWTKPSGTKVMIAADRAVRTNNIWLFFNAQQFEFRALVGSGFVPTLQTNILAIPEFNETTEEIRSEIRISRHLTVKNRHRADLPILEILDYLRLHPNLGSADAAWLYTKLHSRLAGPWKCLVVVFIALPFGAPSGRRNIFVGVASSILICFAYFVLLEVSLALGTAGKVPPWLAGWLPNIFFGLTGAWLTARVR
jgi:LPS export ABC transporter permease LptG